MTRSLFLTRVLATTLGALCLAVVVHIAVILLIPRLAPSDPWAALGQLVDGPRTVVLPQASPRGGPLSSLDPNVVYSACRFDLSEGPLAVTAASNVEHWVLGLYRLDGTLIYSLTSQTELAQGISLELRTPGQERGQTIGAAPTETLEITADIVAGFVLYRTLVPFPSARDKAKASAARLTCKALPDRL